MPALPLPADAELFPAVFEADEFLDDADAFVFDDEPADFEAVAACFDRVDSFCSDAIRLDPPELVCFDFFDLSAAVLPGVVLEDLSLDFAEVLFDDLPAVAPFAPDFADVLDFDPLVSFALAIIWSPPILFVLGITKITSANYVPHVWPVLSRLGNVL